MQEGFGGLKFVETWKMQGRFEEGFLSRSLCSLLRGCFTEALHRWAPKKAFVFYFSSNQTQQLAVRHACFKCHCIWLLLAFALRSSLRSDLT